MAGWDGLFSAENELIGSIWPNI